MSPPRLDYGIVFRYNIDTEAECLVTYDVSSHVRYYLDNDQASSSTAELRRSTSLPSFLKGSGSLDRRIKRALDSGELKLAPLGMSPESVKKLSPFEAFIR